MKPRRWFRYTLRTLFVLLTLSGIALGWLAVQVKWKHDRSGARKSIQSYSPTRLREFGFDLKRQTRAPIGLRLLGEQPVTLIVVPRQTAYSKAELERLFPEAQVADKNKTTFVPDF